MPRAVKHAKPHPDATYVAWDSASIGSLPEAPVVQRGTRLQGDSELVRAVPWLFVEDSGDQRETERNIRQRHTAEVVASSEASSPPSPPVAPLRDEDALLAICDVGGLDTPVATGQRVPPDHPAVKQSPRVRRGGPAGSLAG